MNKLLLTISVILFFRSACKVPLNIKCDKWIIVTTIQYPTESLRYLANFTDWQLLVIGDKKTPSDWYLNDQCIYLNPHDQELLPYELVKLLPWNHYARKNIGYLFAIEHGAQMIYETDDDNHLTTNIDSFKNNPNIITLSSNNPVINVYSYFGQPTLWPRGYPLNWITRSHEFEINEQPLYKKIIIEQGLINNEPDLDAIFRLTRSDSNNIIFDVNKAACILGTHNMCPFNTQNTRFHKEAFWGLYIPTHVPFRVCDIWRGYFTQRILREIDGCICFTPATAIQKRNPHDLMRDFIDEQDLYTKVPTLINALNIWVYSKNHTILENMCRLYDMAMESGFIGKEETSLINAWVHDLQKLIK